MKAKDLKKLIVVPIVLVCGILVYLAFFRDYSAYSGGLLLLGAQENAVLETETQEFIQQFISIHNEEEPDTRAPLILSGSSFTVEEGAEKVPGPLLCMDDVDKQVACKVVGTYDLNKVGKYSLERVATDAAGNTTRFPFTLNVIEKVKKTEGEKDNTTSSQGPTLPIADAIATYKTGDNKIGIDVSKWQGDIDWQKVKDAGVEFVMIRLGAQDGFGGKPKTDSKFVQNFKGAKEAGLLVGAYFYSYSTSLEESIEQAVYVTEVLVSNDFQPDLPIAYDWESFSYLGSKNISLNEFNDNGKIFIDIMRQVGFDGYLYTSKYYLEKQVWYLGPEYPVWLAHYTKQTDYAGDYVMWQCSCTGKVPGIDGYVDINVMYK